MEGASTQAVQAQMEEESCQESAPRPECARWDPGGVVHISQGEIGAGRVSVSIVLLFIAVIRCCLLRSFQIVVGPSGRCVG